MENPIKMDDLGGTPLYFLETPICLGILACSAFQNQQAQIFAKVFIWVVDFSPRMPSGKSEETF